MIAASLLGSTLLSLPFLLSPLTASGQTKELSCADWAGLREACEASQHAAFPVEGGYQVQNPGQEWRTRFDGRGFLVEPHAGEWSWGLELESYGFAGSERIVTEPEHVSADGQRVAYSWDSTLEEWYRNDSRGLEHGYTVHRRPPRGEGGAEAPLTLTLGVRGELRPVATADGRDVCFLDKQNIRPLTYTGLCVFDAEGRELLAGFEAVGERLLLRIEERGASYPLTIDPLVQRAYLKASNTGWSDTFGSAVAVSGNTAVVGAAGEDSAATGVNGDQSDNSAADSGAAYVFMHDGTSWSQEAYLKASNAQHHNLFGSAVAISGDTIVIGARGENSDSTGVNGNQDNWGASDSGAAYVFVRNGTNWSQEAYLKASNTDSNDLFGYSVGVSGDLVVVGAQDEESAASGVNGNQSNNNAEHAGAAYVFSRTGASWAQEAYLKASNTETEDRFGRAVSVSGDTVVVGAYGEDSSATGVNGDQGDNNGWWAGASYVFRRTGTSWAQEAYLKASNTHVQDFFGHSVAVSEDTVVVGAYGEPSNATGVNGNENGNGAGISGAAYVFARVGTHWSQQAYLKATNTDPGDWFGNSVAVSGDTVVVGAPYESSNATGMNGDQSDNTANSAGAAYVYVRRGTVWATHAYLKASNTDASDRFGHSVSVSDGIVLAGAVQEDSGSMGVNGDQSDNGTAAAGAAYLFELVFPGIAFGLGDPGSGTPCPCANDNDGSVPGSGCANGAYPSGAQLSGSGAASVSADTLVLTSTGLPPNDFGVYIQADNALNGGDGVIFGDGLRCVGPILIHLEYRKSSAGGTSATTIHLGAKGGVAPGDTKRYQYWYRDNSGAQPCGVGVNDFNLSNGYEIPWLP